MKKYNEVQLKESFWEWQKLIDLDLREKIKFIHLYLKYITKSFRKNSIKVCDRIIDSIKIHKSTLISSKKECCLLLKNDSFRHFI